MKSITNTLGKYANYSVLRGIRRLSTAQSAFQSPYQNYGKALLKRFMFQTHPDFFGNHLKLQAVNSSNLRYLQSLIDEPWSEQSIKTRESMRTLTFYLKTDDKLDQPRKVKVSINRMLDSIAEILETVGAELPPKPKGYTSEAASSFFRVNREKEGSGMSTNIYGTRYEQYEKSWLTTETKQIIDFLESLHDRIEVLEIKRDLYQRYKDIEESVINITGLSDIEYRNSWSMQNNALLLKQLLQQLQDHPEKFSLPWAGLRLIFAVDHGYIGPQGQSAVAVDYLEGIILIDCLEVSATWIDKLRHICQADIQQATPLREEIETMRLQSEKYVHHLLQAHLFRKSQENSSNISQSVQSQHRIEITCGHTCTKRQFGSALHTFLTEVAQFKDVFLSQQATTSSSTDCEGGHNILLHKAPLSLSINLEVAYGTKVLSDGKLRIDATLLLNPVSNASVQGDGADSLQRKLEQRLGSQFLPNLVSIWLQSAYQQQLIDLEIATLEQHLKCILELNSLKMGIGVTQEKYLRLLRVFIQYLDHKNHLGFIGGQFDFQSVSFDDAGKNTHHNVTYGGQLQFDRAAFEEYYYPYYTRQQNMDESSKEAQRAKKSASRIKNRGVLKHLSGFAVNIGHYTGVLEDGTCILPWDFPLQQLIVIQAYESQ